MASNEKIFIFSSLGAKQPGSARKVHIRRLYDILQLSIQRGEYARARKAWSILIRCKEVDWRTMWKTGAQLVGETQDDNLVHNSQKLEYLSTMMLRYPEARQAIFQELILRYIQTGQHNKALDELELYLPSQPYESNPVLHVYAGLICLYLAQPPSDTKSNWNPAVLRDAQLYLEKARTLDPENVVALAWLEQIPSLTEQSTNTSRVILESDEEDGRAQLVLKASRTKRARR